MICFKTHSLNTSGDFEITYLNDHFLTWAGIFPENPNEDTWTIIPKCTNGRFYPLTKTCLDINSPPFPNMTYNGYTFICANG